MNSTPDPVDPDADFLIEVGDPSDASSRDVSTDAAATVDAATYRRLHD